MVTILHCFPIALYFSGVITKCKMSVYSETKELYYLLSSQGLGV